MEKILFISPSTLDWKNLLGTIIVCILPTLFFGWMFYRCLATDSTYLKITWGCATALFLIIAILGYICTPNKYILTDAELIIKRHIKDVVIPLQSIKLIRLMTKDDKKGMTGVSQDACFGSWGYLWTTKHKKVFFVTRRSNNWTLIITDHKKYVISPDDTQLIDAVAQQIGKTEAEMQPSTDIPSTQWRKFIPAAIVAPVFLLGFMAYKEPRVVFDSDAFRMRGIYGVNIPFAEIAKADTIALREMPAISIRTNGISLFKVHRGNFRTTDGEKVRLSINRSSSPVIKIVERNGAVYYINRKNAAETRQIFNKIKK